MHRTSLVVLSGIMLLGLIGTGGAMPSATAQDAATPAGLGPGSWGIPGFEVLGALGNPSLAQGMTLELERLTWEPGFTVGLHTHPANDIVYVISGEVAWAVENGAARVTRASVAGTPGPTEMLSPGAEVTLQAGDAVAFDYLATGLQHAARVVGEEPAVMLIATIYDPTKPLTVFAEETGTPVP